MNALDFLRVLSAFPLRPLRPASGRYVPQWWLVAVVGQRASRSPLRGQRDLPRWKRCRSLTREQDAKVTKEKQKGHEEGSMNAFAFLRVLSAFPLRPSRPASGRYAPPWWLVAVVGQRASRSPLRGQRNLLRWKRCRSLTQEQDAKDTKEEQKGHEEKPMNAFAFLGVLSAFSLRPSRPASGRYSPQWWLVAMAG
ncbi:MAG: hypothetical protein AB7E72_20970 [Lysobacterales bacterium]